MPTVQELTTNLPFLPFKQRNSALDSLFYDTSSLSPDEALGLSPLIDKEGSIIVVPPTGKGEIRHYKNALRFMNKEGDQIRAIAVAGVGSSVLGTAALARNVADALGYDVAGIVTGYGMMDLMTEALGGWFIFGAADRARLNLEQFVERASTTLPEAAVGSTNEVGHSSLRMSDHFWSGMPGNNDVTTLLDILTARAASLELVVGHSKGCLLIDFALEQFVEEIGNEDHPMFKKLHVLTFGAVVNLPRQFRNTQYLGEIDWFGGMNSRLSEDHIKVLGAWHHLNRKMPAHLDVVATITEWAKTKGVGKKGSDKPEIITTTG